MRHWKQDPSFPGHFTDSIAALFKIANGEDISKAPAPGMFDLKVRSPPPRSHP